MRKLNGPLIILVALLLSNAAMLLSESKMYAQDKPERGSAEWHAELAEKKAETDKNFETFFAGILDYDKTSYKSEADKFEVPVYTFMPKNIDKKAKLPVIVWVHENLHGDLYNHYIPFIKEAVERGYIVVAPEYRGSTGYGKEFYDAIDYGGYEVDDVVSSVKFIKKKIKNADLSRLGIIGWSHGGMIAFLATTRNPQMFSATASIVPVSNLIFRLGYKGPRYMKNFEDMERVGKRPHEAREEFKYRSPLYQVDNLESPVLVHLSDSDTDVNYEEAQQLMWALLDKKPHLSEVKVYKNPTGSSGGHGFSRIVDPETFERLDTPEQRDSWNRTWTFFEWHLKPYLKVEK